MTTIQFEDMPFSDSERTFLSSIINGYVMGDGYVFQEGSLQVDQGAKQRSFVDWMQGHLQPFLSEVGSKAKKLDREYMERNPTSSYRFFTCNHLKNLHKAWYYEVEGINPRTGKEGGYLKKLPDNIRELFNPVFITVWYACDGSRYPINTQGRRVKFALDSYSTAQDRETLKSLFLELYGIKSEINKNGFSKKRVQQWKLDINAESYETFHKLITEDCNLDLIPRLFPHKLHKRNNN